MDEANKSQGQIRNQSLTRSQRSSTCPTAKSPGVLTANTFTDPGHIPTALSNSTRTAIGATSSDFEGLHGMTDTSAGSSKPNSKGTSTAMSPSSPQILLNDLRRGTLFGRQSNSESAPPNGPHSITNVTFSNTTFVSTASQGSEIESSSSSEMEKSNKSAKSAKSAKTAKSSAVSTGKASTASTANSRKSRVMSIMEKNKDQMKINKELKDKELSGKMSVSKSRKSKMSKKGTKSGSSKGVSKKSKKTMKSMKSMKSTKRTQPMSELSGKSAKNSKMSSKMSSKMEEKSEKTLPLQKNVDAEKKLLTSNSVSLKPAVNNESARASPGFVPPKSQPTAPKIHSLQDAKQKRQAAAVTYNFPGVGRCTKNMDSVAPPSPMGVNMNTQNANHCVYDVARLQSSQRRVPPPKMLPTRAQKPKSIFGAPMVQQPPLQNVESSAAPIENKVVVYGITPDGKNKVEFTIQMRLVSGEALGLSNEPVDFVPKKVIVGGKEIAVETPKQQQKKLEPSPKPEVDKLQ